MGKVLEKSPAKQHTFQGVCRHPGYHTTRPFQTLWDIHHFGHLQNTILLVLPPQ